MNIFNIAWGGRYVSL